MVSTEQYYQAPIRKYQNTTHKNFLQSSNIYYKSLPPKDLHVTRFSLQN